MVLICILLMASDLFGCVCIVARLLWYLAALTGPFVVFSVLIYLLKSKNLAVVSSSRLLSRQGHSESQL